MKAIRPFLACVSVLVLISCGQPAATAPQPKATTATSSESAPDASAAAADNALTPTQLVGRWGDNGDCAKDVVFNANGTFTSYTGGSGTWSLDGDIVTMTAANGAFQLRVSLLNERTLLIGNPDGTFGTSQRC